MLGSGEDIMSTPISEMSISAVRWFTPWMA
jgi:hypothetical protein